MEKWTLNFEQFLFPFSFCNFRIALVIINILPTQAHAHIVFLGKVGRTTVRLRYCVIQFKRLLKRCFSSPVHVMNHGIPVTFHDRFFYIDSIDFMAFIFLIIPTLLLSKFRIQLPFCNHRLPFDENLQSIEDENINLNLKYSFYLQCEFSWVPRIHDSICLFSYFEMIFNLKIYFSFG